MLKWDLVVDRPPFVDGDKLIWTDTSDDENITYEIKVISILSAKKSMVLLRINDSSLDQLDFEWSMSSSRRFSLQILKKLFRSVINELLRPLPDLAAVLGSLKMQMIIQGINMKTRKREKISKNISEMSRPNLWRGSTRNA